MVKQNVSFIYQIMKRTQLRATVNIFLGFIRCLVGGGGAVRIRKRLQQIAAILIEFLLFLHGCSFIITYLKIGLYTKFIQYFRTNDGRGWLCKTRRSSSPHRSCFYLYPIWTNLKNNPWHALLVSKQKLQCWRHLIWNII